MKRILAVLLTMIMVTSMAGCNSATNVEGTHEHTTSDDTQSTIGSDENTTNENNPTDNSDNETDESTNSGDDVTSGNEDDSKEDNGSTEDSANNSTESDEANSTESDENNSTAADENNSTESDENNFTAADEENSTEDNNTTEDNETNAPTTSEPATSQPTTGAPVEKPTEKPTEAPTQKPTEAPTEEPTETPTESPTETPTEDSPCAQGHHNWANWYVSKEPTDTEDGIKQRDCYACGTSEIIVLEKFSTHTHDYVNMAALNNGTVYACQTGGQTLHQCYCGASYTTEPTFKESHWWISEKTYHATCTQYGYTVYKCHLCHTTTEVQTEEPIGHEYMEEVREPSCRGDGYTLHYCIHQDWNEDGILMACQEHYKTDFVPACHNWGEWQVIVEPTPTQDGLKHKYCENYFIGCGGIQEETIPYVAPTE